MNFHTHFDLGWCRELVDIVELVLKNISIFLPEIWV